MDNRRQHFRIRYPADARPRFVNGTTISEVVECSEGGIRVLPAADPPLEGSPISGRLSLCHGAQLTVAGTVVWSDGKSVAIHLHVTPIPFLAILREQLYLRRLAGSSG
jgi:hypothetical protein